MLLIFRGAELWTVKIPLKRLMVIGKLHLFNFANNLHLKVVNPKIINYHT